MHSKENVEEENSSGSKLVGLKAKQQNDLCMNPTYGTYGGYLSFLKLLGLIVPFLGKCTQGANPKQPFFNQPPKFAKKKAKLKSANLKKNFLEVTKKQL
jgi:hypothetical protein